MIFKSSEQIKFKGCLITSVLNETLLFFKKEII